MTIKNRIRLKANKRVNITSATLSALAAPAEITIIARLEITVGGNPLFEGLDDDEAGIEKGIAILRKLWPLSATAATALCVKDFGPGVRPTLWWEAKERPFVKPRDWNDVNDGARFARERAEADLEFLRAHGHLTKDELQLLAKKEKGNRK